MFKCPHCGYDTDYKQNYSRHINSKRHQKVLLNNSRNITNITKSKKEDDLDRSWKKLELERESLDMKRKQMELDFHLNQQKSSKTTNIQNNQSNIFINGGNNHISKEANLNFHFHDMIDINTFAENLESKYPLTFEQTKILLENYHSSGLRSYGEGLFYYLKKNCAEQMKEISGKEPKVPMIPFICSDGSLRTHLEKTTEGWEMAKMVDNIKKLVIISNDQIYKHHQEFIPMSSYEKLLIANILIRKSDYKNVMKNVEKTNTRKKLT